MKNYVAAINTQNYSEAWAVGGKNTGVPFSVFVSDFDTTAYDHLTISSVSGRVVTAQLIAYQVTGAVETSSEVYTVQGNVIARIHFVDEGSVTTKITPVAILREYVAAINRRDYAEAWAIEGKNEGGSYSEYAKGFDTTAYDRLTILSVSGRVVSARLVAYQTDGAVKIYQGTWNTDSAFIIQLDVRQVG